MCAAVADTFADPRTSLVAGAGTGTGKTLAYLVPAVTARRPVIVATATKALQDQILRHDIPMLAAGVGRKVTAVTLKGRGSYLCVQKTKDLRQKASDGSLDGENDLPEDTARLLAWEAETDSGDQADLTFEPSAAAWAAVSSGSDECPGQSSCPSGAQCFYERHRETAEKSDVVIVNHHLYLHLVQRTAGLVNGGTHRGEQRRPVVIDEAHELADTAAQVLGTSVARRRFASVAKRLRSLDIDEDLVKNLNAAADSLFGLLAENAGELLPRPLPYDVRFAASVASISLQRTGKSLHAMIETAREDLLDFGVGRSESADPTDESDDSDESEVWVDIDGPGAQRGSGDSETLPAEIRAMERLAASVTSLAGDLRICITAGPETASWAETLPGRDTAGASHGNIQWRTAPIDVADTLDELIWRGRASVITSATLPPGYERRIGIEPSLPIGRSCRRIDVGSPFDYPHHVLYCPKDLPRPGQPGYDNATHDEMTALIEAAEGRTLALFTSWAALDRAAAHLRDRLPYTILTQRDHPKPELFRRFADDPHTCLLGTLGLWQGIDIPGDSLQLVIIARLPFPRPDDPLLNARREAAGKDAFRAVDIPISAVRLAQGAGRLIRTETDQGAVAVLDSRLANARYRKLLLDTLPPFRRTTSRDDITSHLTGLRQPALDNAV